MGKKLSTDLIVTSEQIQNMVRVVRGQRVMLDFDLARLDGVQRVMLDFDLARLYDVTTIRRTNRSGAIAVGSPKILRINLPSKSLQL